MSDRELLRATLTVGAVAALALTAGLLPAFEGAAPANDIVDELRTMELDDDAVAAGEADGDADDATNDAGDDDQGGSENPAGKEGDGSSDATDAGSGSGGGDGGGALLGNAGSGGNGGFELPGLDRGFGATFLDLVSRFGGGGGAGAGTGSGSGTVGGSEAVSTAGGTDGAEGQGLPNRCRPANGPYTVCFEEELSPGMTTTVSVAGENGEPVAGVGVVVNGRSASVTDAQGLATVTVPYATEMVVTVREDAAAAMGSAVSVAGAPMGDGHVSTARVASVAVAKADEGASIPVDADVEIKFMPEPTAGQTAELLATVNDQPMADAVVAVDGETVARTDDEGRVRLTFPATTTATVMVTRDEIQGSKQVTLSSPAITIDGDGPLGIALPGRDATVVVTESGEPVAGAEVVIDGERVGATDEEGVVTTSLPAAPTVTVEATLPSGVKHSRTARLYAAPFAAGLIGLLGLVGAALAVRRADSLDPRAIVDVVRTTGAEVARTVADRVVGIAAGVESALGAALAAVTAVWRSVRAPEPVAALRGLLDQLLDRFRDAGTRTASRVRNAIPESLGTRAVRDAGLDADDGSIGPRDRVLRAWWSLVSLVGLRRIETMTPGDVARKARNAGLPAGPVDRLADAFRAVNYSSADPGPHAETAARAVDELGVDDSGDDPGEESLGGEGP